MNKNLSFFLLILIILPLALSGQTAEIDTIQSNEVLVFDYQSIGNDYYRLARVEAIYTGVNFTDKNIAIFNAEAEREYQLNDMVFVKETMDLYHIERSSSRFMHIRLKQRDNHLCSVDCRECQDQCYRIHSDSPNQIVLDVPSQDEDSPIIYRYTLIK